MKLQTIIDALAAVSPLHLAEPWDKVGLQLGDPAQNIRHALLCIDLTPAVAAEAAAKKASLVVAYHPPIFEPLASLATGSQGDWKQRAIVELVRRRIALFTPHTALDAAEGGVNDFLAAGLGDARVTPIAPRSADAGRGDLKLVVFVPLSHADGVRRALGDAGAGLLGAYAHCSFNLRGEGRFFPLENAEPAIGRPGRAETVEEVRVEVLCPRAKALAILDAMKKAHPYEEAAFDLYPLEQPPSPATTGQGRLVELREPVSLDTLLSRVKKHLGTDRLDVSLPAGKTPRDKVSSVALCAGAGASVVKRVERQAQVYFTGEMRHHDILDAVQRGKIVVRAGHTQTERPFLPAYAKRLAKALGPGVSWHVSRADQAP